MSIIGHTDFQRAFQPDTIFECRKRGEMFVHQLNAGDLVLPTGQIIACDPSYLMHPGDLTPFTHTCPAGQYPVTLALATYLTPPMRGIDDHIACAMVRFKSTEAIRWQMALLPDQDVDQLPLGRFYGYAVESYLGCFIDAHVLEHLTRDSAETCYSQQLRPAIYGGEQRRYWANITLDPVTSATIVVFRSHCDDVTYPSYWGIDAMDEVCCLVTDFQILVESIEGEAEFLLSPWLDKPIEHPDLQRLEVQVHVRLLDSSAQHIQVEVRGANADSCEDVMITNHTKEYYSWQPQVVVNGGYTMNIILDEPLQPDATLKLQYSMGVRAL